MSGFPGWGQLDFTPLWISLRLAAATTLILMVLGLPLACWLARTRSRLRPLLEAVTALPLVLPPTVLGFYLLVAMGSRSPLGQAWEDLFGAPLAFSFEGLVAAYMSRVGSKTAGDEGPQLILPVGGG